MRMKLISRVEKIYNFIKNKSSFILDDIKVLFPNLNQDYLYFLIDIVKCRYSDKLKLKRVTQEKYKYIYKVEVLA